MTPARTAPADVVRRGLRILAPFAGALLALPAAAAGAAGEAPEPHRGSLSAELLAAAFAIGVVMAAWWLASLRHRRSRGLVLPVRPAPRPSPGERDGRLVPADPERRWSAQIEWREGDGGGRFCVTAREAGVPAEAVIGVSRPLRWPPGDREAVRELTRAADDLATEVTAAGWRPVAAGGDWFAKRFEWEPATGRSPAEAR